MLAVSGSVPGCGRERGPKLTLRYHPPAGASYRYTLEQRNGVKVDRGPLGAMPAQQVTMRIYFTQSVTGPAEGGLGVTIRFDSTTLESPSMVAGALEPALQRMRGTTTRLVLDDRMNVVHAEFVGVAGTPSPITEQIGKNVQAIAFPLPEQPVGVGDSWSAETELPLGQIAAASGPIKATTTLTVKEIHSSGPDTTVLIGMQTTFPGDPITVSPQGQPYKVKLSGKLSGEQLFSLTRSAALRSSMGGTMQMNVSGGPAGAKGMNVSMEQSTNLQLIDGK